MDAHDDLMHLFRQVGASRDAYREFDLPVLPDVAPIPTAPGVVHTLDTGRTMQPANRVLSRGDGHAPLTGTPISTTPVAARFGLPDGSLG